MPGIDRVAAFGTRSPDLVERQDVMVGADVRLVVAEGTDAGVLIAVIGDVDDDARRPGAHIGARRADPAAPRFVGQQPVHDRCVRGVEAAFERLQPVAFLDDFGDVAMALRSRGPGEFRQRRRTLGRAHIGPDDATQFDGRIGGQVDLVTKRLGLVHLFYAAAVDGEFPAVIDAAQPIRLVAPEPKRGPAVRTVFVDEADPAGAVAKGDEVLPQQPHPHRRAIGLGQFPGEQGRDPIEPHRRAHRGALSDAGQQLVLLARQHGGSPSPVLCGPQPAAVRFHRQVIGVKLLGQTADGSAVGARDPQYVAVAVAVDPAPEHEEVVGEAVEVSEGIGIDRLRRRQRGDQALGPAGYRARQMETGGCRGPARQDERVRAAEARRSSRRSPVRGARPAPPECATHGHLAGRLRGCTDRRRDRTDRSECVRASRRLRRRHGAGRRRLPHWPRRRCHRRRRAANASPRGSRRRARSRRRRRRACRSGSAAPSESNLAIGVRSASVSRAAAGPGPA